MAVGLALATTGCLVNFDETTFVKVAQPRAVAVGVQTPKGGEWLLEGDGASATKELPASNPPNTEGNLFATVKREGAGDVVLSCPSCKGGVTAHAVPLFADIKLEGEIDKTVHWTPETLAMRYSHIAMFPCYRHPGSDCPREAIALWLQTPRENVLQVRHVKLVSKSYGEITGAQVSVVVGGLADALGLTLAGLFAFDSDARHAPTLGVASGFLGVGTFFLIEGIATLRAKDVDEVVYRAPAPAP